MTTPTLDIKLQGRAYSVACPPDEREALLEAVALLDAKMADIAKKTKSSGERLAVMAALNLAHELLSTRVGGGVDMGDFKRRMTAMQDTIDAALADQDELF